MCLEGIEPTPNWRPNQIVQRVSFATKVCKNPITTERGQNNAFIPTGNTEKKYAYTSHTSQGGFGQFDIKGGIIWFAVENIKFVFFVVITWNKGKEGLKTTYSGSCKKKHAMIAFSFDAFSKKIFRCVEWNSRYSSQHNKIDLWYLAWLRRKFVVRAAGSERP